MVRALNFESLILPDHQHGHHDHTDCHDHGISLRSAARFRVRVEGFGFRVSGFGFRV